MLTAKKILRHWLPLAAVIVLLSGLVYLTVQQSLRMGANDPQIQMAEDAATSLVAGASPQSILPTARVDISRSLAPFLVVYQDTGEPLAASGLLNGTAPLLPAGIFDYTRQQGEDRVTWQPQPGIRVAAVVVAFNGPQPGFVLAGRSLREVENRESQTEQITGIAMLLTLAGSLIILVFCEWFLPGKKHTP